MNLTDIAESSLISASKEYMRFEDPAIKLRYRIFSLLKFHSLLLHARTSASIGLLSLQQAPTMEYVESREDFHKGYL